MTIAAGFLCNEGIVLAADTELGGPGFKQSGRKTWTHAVGAVTVSVTGAGEYVLLKLAAEEILGRIKSNMTIEAVKRVIEQVLASIHADHIDKSPEWAQSGGYGVSLLIGVRAKDGVGLFESYRTGVSHVADFRCVGTGSPVANYIAATLFSRTLPLTWAQIVAAYVIQQTTTYGEGCGGQTTLALVPRVRPGFDVDGASMLALQRAGSEVHEALGGLLRAVVYEYPDEMLVESGEHMRATVARVLAAVERAGKDVPRTTQSKQAPRPQGARLARRSPTRGQKGRLASRG